MHLGSWSLVWLCCFPILQHPVVMALSSSLKHDPTTLAAVREQLGYMPSNFVRVVSWTQQDEPVVLQTYPLDGGSSRRKRRTDMATPFPTLYWLCHAKIHTAIAELERLGYAKRMVLTSGELVQLWECHAHYAKERWESLTEEDRQNLPASVVPMLRDSGIAGANVTDGTPPSFKCLHAHYAQYRVHGTNPVGAQVERLLQQKWPELGL